MKVRVCYTTDASDDYRQALSHSWGDHGQKATREDVRNYLRMVGASGDDDLMQEWQDCKEGCQK